MPRFPGYLLLTMCLSLPVATSAQTSTTAPASRDPQAVALVQRSITALGGSAASTLLNVQAQGTLTPTPGSYVPAGTFT